MDTRLCMHRVASICGGQLALLTLYLFVSEGSQREAILTPTGTPKLDAGLKAWLIQCWHVVRKDGADLSTTVYLGKW